METTLALWRCIGCGAMGNAEDCIGTCEFRKVEIVTAQDYADLLERRLMVDEEAERLTEAARAVAALAAPRDNLDGDYRALQRRARDLLRTLPRAEEERPDAAAPDDERAFVWLCAACGQAEAPQNCLGVCIRRMGEYVHAGDYDELADQLQSRQGILRELTSLLRQFAWVAPRAGQEERTLAAFKQKAAVLARSFDTEAPSLNADDDDGGEKQTRRASQARL